jgi:hypothetical protein
MGYTQIRSANPNAKSYPGYCLQLVTESFFTTPGGHNTARDAWDASGTKNTSRAMPSVQVPVFFSWVGTINGVRKDWGHVVVYFPGRGFLSSPGKWTDGYGNQWFSSIEAVERWFNAPYLGFTLDIPMRGPVASFTPDPTPTPTPTPTPSGTTCTVEPWPAQTSTLWGIAELYYGDGSRWPEIYNANAGTIGDNPSLIHPGMVLTIPGV